jgi:hypothetical protein
MRNTTTNKRLSKISVLKIDKDCIISRDLIRDWIRLVVIPTCRAYGVTVLSVATCPSPRKGFHVYAEITRPVHAELAWRLQFLLGDDCKRVSLNRARLRAGFSGWNKLFEPAGTKPKPIYNRARRCNEKNQLVSRQIVSFVHPPVMTVRCHASDNQQLAPVGSVFSSVAVSGLIYTSLGVD